ncbi:hypothetical protein MPTK1_8g13960 [Marchantia polymorpha subsp. ruderalis]|uniref:BRO1 domain-containing protein n=1 Tax=Marchantia polymorpha TaxID=3197 RepID=A0A2R6WCU6_MARPO|nr:hypothetical protein MARPO_0108s0021 [Marchantia polymorpha]BBN19824.1 hypothetical protein Mp_8g13960 [Marchantia polymorpha subsp. ruderalis]|eukprot:PTQ31673.1 hypothetical protein MARPO_0108s0021 [Marchantia polymorpha]
MLLHFQDSAKLKTRNVAFETSYYARDSITLSQLRDLSSKRRAIEESINGSSHLTPAIAREMAGGVTSPIAQDLLKLEGYLPLLENLIECVQAEINNKPQVRQWTVDLRFRWTSPLSGSSVNPLSGPKYYRVDDLRYELCMVLNLFGALLRERALEILPVDLIKAAQLFRQAAGVYQHMAEKVLPDLQPVLAISADRPPEATVTMATIMSIVCLAEAQAVTARKAEEKGTSGSLLAKLHYGVVQLLDEALNILRERDSESTDVSEKFRRFLNLSKVLHESRSQRYIAADFRTEEKLGMAVGVLRHSMNRVQMVRPPYEDVWKPVYRQEIDALGQMLRKCEQENEFIWRDKVPRVDELPILEGKKLVMASPYQAFGLDRDFVFVT